MLSRSDDPTWRALIEAEQRQVKRAPRSYADVFRARPNRAASNLDWRTMSSVPWQADVKVAEHPARYVMRKLPQLALLFWILKIIAVTLGETAGDLFGITLKLGYVATALVFLGYFLVVLTLQIRAKRFHPAIFWAVVLGTSMVGTEISDFLDRGPGHGSAPNGVGYGW